MALKKLLDTPFQVDAEIHTIGLNSLAIDPTNSLAHLGYATIEENGNVFQQDLPYTLADQDYTDFLARTNQLGVDNPATLAQKHAALEYAPGQGTVLGDTKTLDTPYIISGEVIGYEVDSFAYNTADRLVHIGYSQLESTTVALVEHIPWTLSGVEAEEFMERIDVLGETMSVTQAEIQTCLEFLPGEGTIQDV